MPTQSFGTIRNNTALKPIQRLKQPVRCFGTIRNNTALKRLMGYDVPRERFGTIRNNTALKQIILSPKASIGFWDHSKQHGSKTYWKVDNYARTFWDHSKQHGSKTVTATLTIKNKVLGPFETTRL